ncbi:MAG TPA: thiamine phosphate synthase [Clostridia bacterium]
MQEFYRMIDANVNRASEGLRVLEDISRFIYNDKTLTPAIKELRHSVRKSLECEVFKCIEQRDSASDVGLSVSRDLKLDSKSGTKDLISANFKRVQEALRVIEESLHVLNKYELSKMYESMRFNSYVLEKDFIKHCLAFSKKQKLETDLYCLTAHEHSLGRSNTEVVKAMINAGIKLIQYREKDKSLKEKYNECSEIRKITKDSGVTFIINDDIHIAMMVGADGVHIGQDDLPPDKVRSIVGDEMIIGVSTHSPEQAQKAISLGADYIGVGPIFKTFTKKDVCDPVGLSYLQYAVKNVDVPFVAIGGIKEHNMDEVVLTGAKCIAMVTEIVGELNIEDKIRSIRNKISDLKKSANR